MSIVLSPEVEQQIEEIVRAEGYDSANDFFRFFVQHYQKQREQLRAALNERREEIDRKLEEGLRDLREGRWTEYDSAGLRDLCEEIKRDGRARMKESTDAK